MTAIEATVNGIELREPTVDDGAPLHTLIRICVPLDQNSLYLNLLQCTHFSRTCIVAEREGELVGFVSGYFHPKEEGVFFLWQVGVHPKAAGNGLGRAMIQQLLSRENFRGIHTMHTTITKSNEPSRKLFASVARHEGAELKEEDFFREEHFGGGHEAEFLFRIGPLSSPPK